MLEPFGFVIVMERGDLEAKACLLVESIRRLPALQHSLIYVVQPRAGPRPDAATLRLLERHEVEYLTADLNQTWRRHGPMNKAYASALVEPLVEQRVETLVFLDTDVLVVTEPVGLALTSEEAAVAPIAQWRVGQIGQLVDAPLTPYWEMIYTACGASIPDWSITTTIDRRPMLPYFNSGVVAVRPPRGLFRQWQENAERLGRDPQAQSLAADSREFFFLDQTVWAGTIIAELKREQVRVLSHRYNYPLPAHHLLPEGERARTLEDISLVHYHALFSNLYWMDDIPVSESLASWLLRRLPLRPQFKRTRTSTLLLASHWLSRLPLRRYHHRIVRRLPGIRTTVTPTSA
jgi:hypothetical protein